MATIVSSSETGLFYLSEEDAKKAGEKPCYLWTDDVKGEVGEYFISVTSDSHDKFHNFLDADAFIAWAADVDHFSGNVYRRAPAAAAAATAE